MQHPPSASEAAPRDSATVIILNDGAAGLEVFLVRRHDRSAVLGGAHVFPGGKLDASDMQLPAHQLDQDAAQLQAALAEAALEPARASGLFVAALREAFEECGVLFALGVQPAECAQLADLTSSGLPFNQALQQLGLCLSSSALRPWSRWITPVLPGPDNRRFDTRFFVAALPPGQSARHDAVETTEGVWLRPRAALEQYAAGTIALAPPQIMTLVHLATFADVAGVLQAARSSPPPLILPLAFEEQGERVLCYPGDIRHSVSRRAMPGPTRLHLRQRRFVPAQGFGALWDLG